MTKVLIWPDIYKEQGHWLPALAMAQRLADATYDVAFMGIRDCEDIVAPYGFPFHPILEDIYPLGYTFENHLEPKRHRWKPHHVLPIADNALKDIISAEKPDLLVSGYFNALETLILHYKYSLKFVTITTYLRHPAEDPAMHALTKLVWMSKPKSRKVMQLAQQNNSESVTTDPRVFVSPMDGALPGTPPEFIVCPREFDFYEDHYEHLANVQYIEPMVTLPDPIPAPDAPAPAPPDAGENGEKTVIFGTAGSQVEDYLDQARNMFDSLIEMMSHQGMAEYELVLALGPKLYNEYQSRFRGKKPSNVSFHVWVDQLKVLDDAAVVFTHGGLATIKEAIWKKVPIVIIPHGKDQNDNALRVRKYGVGLMADGSQITAASLRLLFTKAVTSNWIKKKLTRMRGIFEDYELTNPKFVSEIGKIVPA